MGVTDGGTSSERRPQREKKKGRGGEGESGDTGGGAIVIKAVGGAYAKFRKPGRTKGKKQGACSRPKKDGVDCVRIFPELLLKQERGEVGKGGKAYAKRSQPLRQYVWYTT